MNTIQKSLENEEGTTKHDRVEEGKERGVGERKDLVEEDQGKMEEVQPERIHNHRRHAQEDRVLHAVARSKFLAVPLARGSRRRKAQWGVDQSQAQGGGQI